MVTQKTLNDSKHGQWFIWDNRPEKRDGPVANRVSWSQLSLLGLSKEKEEKICLHSAGLAAAGELQYWLTVSQEFQLHTSKWKIRGLRTAVPYYSCNGDVLWMANPGWPHGGIPVQLSRGGGGIGVAVVGTLPLSVSLSAVQSHLGAVPFLRT